MNRRNALVRIAAFAAACTVSATAWALSDRPVRIVIPFAAGANSDVLTRAIAQRVTENGGPTFVIENRPGGGGAIGALAARKAAADGHTLFAANTATHAILPAIQNVAYDPERDFEPITPLFSFPNFLIVPARLPVNNVNELVELAASTPEGLTLGSQGIGSPGHLLGAMLEQETGAQLVHVPYTGGGGPMNIDVVAGRLDLVFSTYASLKQHADDGRVKFLAIASAERSPVAPEIPTIREAGIPGVELDAWFGLVAPAGTPADVVEALNAMFVEAANSPDIVERFKAEGITVSTSSPEDFKAYIQRESARLKAVVDASDLRID